MKSRTVKKKSYRGVKKNIRFFKTARTFYQHFLFVLFLGCLGASFIWIRSVVRVSPESSEVPQVSDARLSKPLSGASFNE